MGTAIDIRMFEYDLIPGLLCAFYEDGIGGYWQLVHSYQPIVYHGDLCLMAKAAIALV